MMPPSLEQFERYLPSAMAIAPDQVRPLRADVSIVRMNAAFGAASILAREADAAALPGTSITVVRALDKLGSALAWAAAEVTRFAPVGDKRAAIATARTMRAKLLKRADALVVDNVLPAHAVAAIRKGRGAIDTAEDCVALAALFYKHAEAISKIYAIDVAEVRETGQLGDRLLATLRRGSAKRRTDPVLAAAIDVRNRMWTLFEDAWEAHVWRPGLYLFGRRAAELVPTLGAKVRARHVATEPSATNAITAPRAPSAATDSAGSTESTETTEPTSESEAGLIA